MHPKLSESTPIVTPVPSRPKRLRATSARMATSPWLVTAPTFVAEYAGHANRSEVSVCSEGSAPTGTRAETRQPPTATSRAPSACRWAASTFGSSVAVASMVTRSSATGSMESITSSGTRAAIDAT